MKLPSINKKILSIGLITLAILIIPIIKNSAILKTDIREARNSTKNEIKPAYDETKKKKSRRVKVKAEDLEFRGTFEEDVKKIIKKYPSEYKERIEQDIGFNFPTATGAISKIPETIKKTLAGSSTEKWEHAGPTGAGVVSTVDFHKNDHKNILIGTYASGLYKSSDFGNNWKKIIFPVNNINEVAIDPNNKNHYLVIANSIYVFESKNGGSEWEKIYTFNNTSITHKNSDLIWNDEKIFLRVDEQLLISENNGSKWKQYDLPKPADSELKFPVRNTKINISGSGLQIARFSKFSTELHYNYVYKTNNYGKSWEPIKADLEGFIYAFDISANGENMSFIKESKTNNDKTIFISKDNGVTWTEKPLVYEDTKKGTIKNFNLEIQDLIFDDKFSNKIYLFAYMGGIFESLDNGAIFKKGPKEFEVLNAISILSDISTLITPLDLRLNEMKNINIAGDDTKPDQTYLLLPTDQGLFTYESSTQKITTISENIYLGETGVVTTTSCPRVYAGLWHVGQMHINSNGNSIIDETYAEKSINTPGEDEGCSTALINDGSDYIVGEKRDEKKFMWVQDNIYKLFNEPKNFNLIKFHDGWWYLFGTNAANEKNILVRFDKNLTTYEILRESVDPIKAFHIEPNSGETNYWLLDGNSILWNSTDLKTWNKFKELKNKENFEIPYMSGTLWVDKNTIILNTANVWPGPAGVFISHDSGETWKKHFANSKGSNIIKDKKGNLYIGVYPRSKPENMMDKDATGVWQSIDNGKTWQLYKKGAEKSWISGLAIESTTNTLYASTEGESLLKIKLPK